MTLEVPQLESAIVDAGARLQRMGDPIAALAEAAMNDVSLVYGLVDVCEDGDAFFVELPRWVNEANTLVARLSEKRGGRSRTQAPQVRAAVGCGPRAAERFDAAAEERLIALLRHKRTSALGEIGLDYTCDAATFECQRSAFRRQVELACEAGVPVVVGVREADGFAACGKALETPGGGVGFGGASDDGAAAAALAAEGFGVSANDDALRILGDVGWPQAGVLLRAGCMSAPQLAPWVEAGCFVSFGPAVLAGADEARGEASGDAARTVGEGAARVADAVRSVPLNRLLAETGASCDDGAAVATTAAEVAGATAAKAIFSAAASALEPAAVPLVAERLAALRGAEAGLARRKFLVSLFDNSLRLLNRKPTAWQLEGVEDAVDPGVVLGSGVPGLA